jgi:hypothetical protein
MNWNYIPTQSYLIPFINADGQDVVARSNFIITFANELGDIHLSDKSYTSCHGFKLVVHSKPLIQYNKSQCTFMAASLYMHATKHRD